MNVEVPPQVADGLQPEGGLGVAQRAVRVDQNARHPRRLAEQRQGRHLPRSIRKCIQSKTLWQ